MRETAPTGEAGVVPYVYLQDIDQTLAKVADAGGEVSVTPYPKVTFWVAMTRDPADDAIGVWQNSARTEDAPADE